MSNLARFAMTSMTVAGLLTSFWSDVKAGDRPGVIQISDRSLQAIPEPNPLPVSATDNAGGNGGGAGGTVHGPVYYGGLEGGQYSATFSGGQVGRVIPTVVPINREPVMYLRYWPDQWYGMPGGGIAADAPRFPQIYMPTDTTQLGFYYQRVPTWEPRPWMLPPPPNPVHLHNYGSPFGHGAVVNAPATTDAAGGESKDEGAAPPPPGPTDE
jgi:hypothetical protein